MDILCLSAKHVKGNAFARTSGVFQRYKDISNRLFKGLSKGLSTDLLSVIQSIIRLVVLYR